MKRSDVAAAIGAVVAAAGVLACLFGGISELAQVLTPGCATVAASVGLGALGIHLLAALVVAGDLLTLVERLAAPLTALWWSVRRCLGRPGPGAEGELIAVPPPEPFACPRCAEGIPPPVEGWVPGVRVVCLLGCGHEFTYQRGQG